MSKTPNANDLARAFAQRLASAPAGTAKAAATRGKQVPATAQPRIVKPITAAAKPDEAALRDAAGTTEGPQNLADMTGHVVPDLERQASDFIGRLASPESAAQGRGGEALAQKISGPHPRREDEKLPQRGKTTRLIDEAGATVGYPQQDDGTCTSRKN